MLHPIIIMLKGIPRIIRRVNINTLHLPGIFLFECFECQEVIAVDEHILAIGVAVAFVGIFEEDAGFELGFVAFSYPGEFEFLFWHVVISF